MMIPLQITARDFDLTEPIETLIREKAEKLGQLHDRITRCRVILESPHRRQQKGVLYNVHVEISIPGKEIVVKKAPHEDLYVSIGNAFEMAQRKLREYVTRQRGDVKFHEGAPHARITQIFPQMDYGILTTSEHREIYFHRNSVLGETFNDLKIGMEVRFVEESGDEGPQASTVRVLKK
jgi:ribosomal subunit interface protein